MEFLLLLLFIFVIVHMLRMGYALWRARRQVRSIFDSFNQEGGAARRRQGANANAPRQKPRKKIDPNVGEYVAFEEIKVETSTEQTTDAAGSKQSTKRVVEQQIVDVEWEDLP